MWKLRRGEGKVTQLETNGRTRIAMAAQIDCGFQLIPATHLIGHKQFLLRPYWLGWSGVFLTLSLHPGQNEQNQKEYVRRLEFIDL